MLTGTLAGHSLRAASAYRGSEDPNCITLSVVIQDEQGSSEEWPGSCSRRDANLFLRGVKRFGTIDRLPDIAAEIGPSFEGICNAARSVFIDQESYMSLRNSSLDTVDMCVFWLGFGSKLHVF